MDETTEPRDFDTKPNRLVRLGHATLSKKRPIVELNAQARLLIEYCVSGCPHPYVSQITRHSPTEDDPERRRPLEPGEPMRLEEAADLLRIRRRRAREIIQSQPAQRELANQLQGLRSGLRARAMMTMGAILENEGDGSAASRKVQLQAATAILGDQIGTPPASSNVSVTVNAGVQLQPGLVIRLPPTTPPTALEGIDAPPSEIAPRTGNFDLNARVIPAPRKQEGEP